MAKKSDKGTWKDGDLDVVLIVYKGKRVTKEQLAQIKKEEQKKSK